MADNWTHIPVMAAEIVEHLLTKPDGVYVDGTLGLGGHAKYFLQRLGPGAKILGFDKDAAAIKMATERVADGRLQAFNKSYEDMREVMNSLGISGADGILLDLGLSSYQLDDGGRGFSFMADGPLDMRFNPLAQLTAKEVVNTYPVEELEKIFAGYGEEPLAARIAVEIFRARRNGEIATTAQLAKVVESVSPRRGKTHPATKIFQALRIEVNDELGTVERGAKMLPGCLVNGGRAAVITFHSLEDRIVKNIFKSLAAEGSIKLVNKKVIEPTWDEIKNNPRSRSAKLRIVEKL
ncbi:16S rRNA (cytosine1402-N4)-methyltransferase [Elusimicrobium simillimum]|uniref:16S rRNA (cytosine(1402)-N(4))-methyltransferase RsmH n=1 Tax=Elusimicrobium simillimum TaxID=3143438 RepID=UPI003C6F2788